MEGFAASQVISPAMVAFTFASAIAPGPNAALMLAVGSRANLASGLRVLAGLALANALTKGALAAGFRWLAELDPLVLGVGRWVAAALTLWLAWRLVRRLGGVGAENGAAGFADAFVFQLANPMVAVTGLAAAVLFCSPDAGSFGHAVGFSAVALPSVIVGAGVWLLIGRMGARRLRGPRTVRALNLAVGVTLIVAIAPMLLG